MLNAINDQAVHVFDVDIPKPRVRGFQVNGRHLGLQHIAFFANDAGRLDDQLGGFGHDVGLAFAHVQHVTAADAHIGAAGAAQFAQENLAVGVKREVAGPGVHHRQV